MEVDSEEFRERVRRAGSFHGHVCSGLYMGVRMEVLAEKLIGFDGGDERFVVEIETDRCPADGVIAAAGLSIGRRRVRMLDYGKPAARFYDASTGRGVRIRFRSDLMPRKGDDVVEFFSRVPDDELLEVRPTSKRFGPCDLPGSLARVATCAACGESVQDGREVLVDGRPCCRECAERMR